jgi:hypothetical protein
MRTEITRLFFIKFSNIKFRQNGFIRFRVAYGRTDEFCYFNGRSAGFRMHLKRQDPNKILVLLNTDFEKDQDREVCDDVLSIPSLTKTKRSFGILLRCILLRTLGPFI